MGSAKAAPRKDPAPTSTVGRRLFMEALTTPHPNHKRRAPPPIPRDAPASKRVRALSRFLYTPGRLLDTERILTAEIPSRLVDVYIAGEYLTTGHSMLVHRHLWGDGRYTDDSDTVAVLAHSGKYVLPVRKGGVEYVRVQLRVSRGRGKVSFPSVERNGVISRAWGDAYDGAVIEVEEVEEVRVEEAYRAVRRPGVLAEVITVPGLETWGKEKRKEGRVKVAYDLCNEPCLEFVLRDVFRLDGKIIDRLVDGEVLYVENDTDRYEVANLDSGVRFARVNDEVLSRIRLDGVGLDDGSGDPPCSFPMAEGDLQVIAKDLAWNQLYWSAEGVTVNGNHYGLTKLLFRDVTQ